MEKELKIGDSVSVGTDKQKGHIVNKFTKELNLTIK